jgi:PAS domain-containing protein
VYAEPLREEATSPNHARATIVDHRFAAAVAEAVADEAGASDSLVVARAAGTPIAVIARNGVADVLTTSDDVTALLDAGADDQRIERAVQALIGDALSIEHAVIFGADGAAVGVVAVSQREQKLARRRARTALGRAAAAAGAWMTSADATRLPVQALVEAMSEPTLVDDDGTIVMANQAVAELFGVGRPELAIGRTLGHFLVAGSTVPLGGHRCMRVRRPDGASIWVALRELSLLVGGRACRATIFREVSMDSHGEKGWNVGVTMVVERLLAGLYPVLRQTARVTMDLHPGAAIRGDQDKVRHLLAVAILDIASTLDPHHAPNNELHVAAWDEGADVLVDVVALGKRNGELPPGARALGLATCRELAAAAEGRVDRVSSTRDRLSITLRLPGAAR